MPQDSLVTLSAAEVGLDQGGARVLVTGTTREFAGQMLLNWDDPAASQFSQFSVNLASLTSDQPERDEALRKQWLESGG